MTDSQLTIEWVVPRCNVFLLSRSRLALVSPFGLASACHSVLYFHSWRGTYIEAILASSTSVLPRKPSKIPLSRLPRGQSRSSIHLRTPIDSCKLPVPWESNACLLHWQALPLTILLFLRRPTLLPRHPPVRWYIPGMGPYRLLGIFNTPRNRSRWKYSVLCLGIQRTSLPYLHYFNRTPVTLIEQSHPIPRTCSSVTFPPISLLE